MKNLQLEETSILFSFDAMEHRRSTMADNSEFPRSRTRVKFSSRVIDLVKDVEVIVVG